MRIMSKIKVFALFAGLLVVSSMACCGNSKKDNKTIAQAEELISQKKYLSAYQLLDKYDPKNENSVIFLKKVDIVQNYFLFNIMNQIFCLDDLPANKTVEELRGQDEASGCSTVMLYIDTIAERLLLKEPDNALLHKCLGDFYVSAARRFGDGWLDQSSESELMSRARPYFLKAEQLGCKDDGMLGDIAESYLYEMNYADARTYFAKAIAQSHDTIANYHYNMAVAYYSDKEKGDLTKAKQHASIAVRHYPQGSDYQYDALYILGMSHLQGNEYAQAIQCFERADKIDAGRYYLLINMLGAQLKSNSPKYEATTERMINLFSESTYVMSALPDIYMVNDSAKCGTLETLLKRQIAKNAGQMSTACCEMSLGALLLDTERKAEARQHLLKAKELFAAQSEADEEIMSYINEMLKHAK